MPLIFIQFLFIYHSISKNFTHYYFSQWWFWAREISHSRTFFMAETSPKLIYSVNLVKSLSVTLHQLTLSISPVQVHAFTICIAFGPLHLLVVHFQLVAVCYPGLCWCTPPPLPPLLHFLLFPAWCICDRSLIMNYRSNVTRTPGLGNVQTCVKLENHMSKFATSLWVELNFGELWCKFRVGGQRSHPKFWACVTVPLLYQTFSAWP